MKRFAFALPLICLAACNNNDVDMKDATPEEVAAAMREKSGGDDFVNPGKWRQTVTLVEIDAPGMPPEARSMMQKAMGEAQVHEICLSKEQAKSLKGDFFTGKDQNCRYEHFKWGSGKIDLKMNCQLPIGAQVMALTGEYQPDSYTMNMTADTTGSGAMEKMTMKMKVDAKQVGECDGSEKLQVGN